MVSAWMNFKNIFPRPLFIIIFRPEMLKFHPYSILTGDTRVEFVVYCLLSMRYRIKLRPSSQLSTIVRRGDATEGNQMVLAEDQMIKLQQIWQQPINKFHFQYFFLLNIQTMKMDANHSFFHFDCFNEISNYISSYTFHH